MSLPPNAIKNAADIDAQRALVSQVMGATCTDRPVARVSVSGGKVLAVLSCDRSESTLKEPLALQKIRRFATTVAIALESASCEVYVGYDVGKRQCFFDRVENIDSGMSRSRSPLAEHTLEFESARFGSDQVAGVDRELDVIGSVRKCYDDNYDFLYGKKFHFASRMALWTGDRLAQKRIGEFERSLVGISSFDQRKIVCAILHESLRHDAVMLSLEARLEYFKKYPMLHAYGKLLLRSLFARTLYGSDTRSVIKEYVPDGKFLSLRDDLLADKQALAALSTHAINYLYALDFYLDRPAGFLDPEPFAELFEKIAGGKKGKNEDLKMYLPTHCIIGESAFYFSKIERFRQVYEGMLKSLEAYIDKNFTAVSLDNKFEFLVCAKLCAHASPLEARIFEEACGSFSPHGNYLVDTLNDAACRIERKGFVESEHRNVLAIMAWAKDVII